MNAELDTRGTATAGQRGTERHSPASEIMAPARGGTLVVRSLGWMLLFAGLRLFAAFVLMATAVAPGLGGGTAARVALGLASASILAIAVRTLLEAVYVEAGGVLVRNIFRSWRLRWDEIEDVAPRERSFSLWLTLRGGRRIPVRGCGSYSRAQRERMASALRAARPETAR
jgi:Bacterial PH domain